MRGTIPPLRQYAFMLWCLVKHRDNFTFTFYTSGSNQVTNSMDQSPSREASSRSAVREIRSSSWGPKFHDHMHKTRHWNLS
jgi:hypothetical protein